MAIKWHLGRTRLKRFTRRFTAFGLVALTLGCLIGSSLPVADAQSLGLSVELSAPAQVKLGAPIQIELAVQNAQDIAGYEANLDFDSSALELNGVSQRHAGDLKGLGRDVQALGPVVRPGGVSFGMYSCPVADCVDRGSTRHDGGGSRRVQLATIELAAHASGVVEMRFSGAKFVDANGNPIGVRNADQTVRVQVGPTASPLFAAPAAHLQSAAVAGHAARVQAGPFDLSERGVVDHADAVQVALAWTQARQQGVVCSPDIDPRIDVNHDGCVDVADAQSIAAHYSAAGVRPRGLHAATTQSGQTANASAQTANAGAPVVFTVNSTGSQDDAAPGDGKCSIGPPSNACTLRAAIDEINAESALGTTFTINFNMPGTGVQTISTNPSLPPIVANNVTINGYSQPGATPNTDPLVSNAHILIQLQGAGADSSTFSSGLTLTSANNVVRGLAFFDYTIAVSLFGLGSVNNQILGNFIGIDATGNNGAPALLTTQAGGGIDINVGAAHNVIGTPARADRNIISGNSVHGITFNNEDTDFNVIQNNLMGLAPDGASTRPNWKHGVDINSQSSFNIIGGTGPNQHNVMSGNHVDGAQISHDTLTVNNTIIGNYIGTDVTGKLTGFGNQAFGIQLHDGVTNNVVSNNVIGANAAGGIDIRDFDNFGNQIVDNLIGVGADGTSSVPNASFGVEVTTNAAHVTIGPGNVIANNPRGVAVPNDPNSTIPPSFGVTITRNSIFNNRAAGTPCGTAGLGIDLAPIDPCNPNTTSPPSANNGILAPKLNAANSTTVDVSSCAGCIVEVFIADAPPAVAGSSTPAGQGKQFVGSGSADGTGHALVAISGPSAGNPLTATATDPQGDTSEFATNIVVGSGSLASPTATPIPTPTNLIALDNFNRQITNGWGSADVGGTWAVESSQRQAGQPASDYTVNNGSASMTDRAANVLNSAYLTNVSARDVDVSFGVQTDQLTPSGGLTFAYFVARRVHSGTGSEYLGRIHFNADHSVGLQAGKTVACSSGFCQTLLGTPVGINGLTQQAKTLIRVRGQVLTVSATTTEIRLKAWADGQPEPVVWSVDVTDNEAGLQGQSGSVGLRTAWTGTAPPTGALTFTFQNFQVGPVAAGPPPTSTPTPAPTSTSVPTATATPTATSTPIATSTPTSTPTPVSTGFTTIRVNAGGPAYTGSDGRAWTADTGFNTGNVYNPSVTVASTLDPTLYQSERYGNFTYNFAVPNGTYRVGLKFAEIYWTTAGRRVFNVSINNQAVLTNFDILAQPNAAPNTALDRTFPVTVNNGAISIAFATLVDNAQVNAIEITAAPAVRVNAGGPAYTGSDGRAWTADTGFNTGNVYNPSVTVASTLDPTLYQSERYGNFTYNFAVPNGTYRVGLKFAEIYWTTAGRRVFNVSINNQAVLTNFDILAQPNAAPNTALDRTFRVTVNNGAISIAFATLVDNAQINAIEIVPGT